MEQSFLNYVFGGVIALLGWFGRTLWDAVQKLKDDLKDIEVIDQEKALKQLEKKGKRWQ